MSGSAIIAQREIGTLPLSFATSEAIQALLDIKQLESTQLYVNVRTLFRNMAMGLDRLARERTRGPEYTDPLVQEMVTINNLIKEKFHDTLGVVFYYCGYEDLAIKYPLASIKKAHTDKQIADLKLETDAMKALLQWDKERTQIYRFKTDLQGSGKIILLTHSPLDLLNNRFDHLLLLESNTGAIKPKPQWNTKLTNGKDHPNIPFCKFTIQVFGDNNTYIAAMPPKIKKEVLAIADADRWHALSTNDRIRASLNKMKDHYGRQFLLRVLRS